MATLTAVGGTLSASGGTLVYASPASTGAAIHYDASLESLGALATFTDRSGNGRHATQSTAGFRPVITANASPLNGKQGLLFDGSDDIMALTGPTFGSSDHTTFVVFMPKALSVASVPNVAVQEVFTHTDASPLTGTNYAQGFNAARSGKWLGNSWASSGVGTSGFYDKVATATGAAEAYATLLATTDGSNFANPFLWLMCANPAGPLDTPSGTWTTAGNGYGLNIHCQTNTVLVLKQKAGAQSTLLSITPPSGVISANDKWLLRYSGSALEVWLQRAGYNSGTWTKQGSIAESEFTSGLFGIETALSAVATIDDWGYGSLPTSASLLASPTAGAAFNLPTLKAAWRNASTNQPASSTLLLDVPNIYTFRGVAGSLGFSRQSIADGVGATYASFTPDRIGENFSGYIYEIISYDRALTSGEQLAIENNLKTKWAIGTTDVGGSGSGIRPYRVDSAWNTDISAWAVDANSTALVAAISANSIVKSSQSGFAGNPAIFSLPIYDVPPGQALMPVFVGGAFTNCTSQTAMLRTNSYLQNIQVPMPLTWQSDEGGDNNTEAVNWNTGDEWGFHSFINAEGRVTTNAPMSIGATTLPVSSANRTYFIARQTNVVLERGTANEETVAISNTWDGTTVPIPLQAASTKAHSSGVPVGGASCGNAFRYNIFWDGVPPDLGVNGPSQGFANSGAGSPYLTGIFRGWEISAGVVTHAIGCDLSDGLATYVSPATKTDQGPVKIVGAGGWTAGQVAGTSLLVADSAGFNYSAPVVGTQITIGYSTANLEVLTVASIPDATHYTFTTATVNPHSGAELIYGNGAIAYGRRFRLKASYDTSGLTGTAKIIADSVKKYGIIYRDGGGHMKVTPEATLSAHWGTTAPALSDAILSVIPLNQLELLA